MRKFKCLKVNNTNLRLFTVGKIYETDDNMLNYIVDNGRRIKHVPIIEDHDVRNGLIFEEIKNKNDKMWNTSTVNNLDIKDMDINYAAKTITITNKKEKVMWVETVDVMGNKAIKLDLSKLTPEQIESLKSQVDKMVEENSKPRELSAKELDKGYIINGTEISSAENYFDNYVRALYSIGLWRATREECEKLLKKMQIVERLRRWSLMCVEKVDWKNATQFKYFIKTGLEPIFFRIDYQTIHNLGCIYFTDKSILERAIADIGEDVLINDYFVEC